MFPTKKKNKNTHHHGPSEDEHRGLRIWRNVTWLIVARGCRDRSNQSCWSPRWRPKKNHRPPEVIKKLALSLIFSCPESWWNLSWKIVETPCSGTLLWLACFPYKQWAISLSPIIPPVILPHHPGESSRLPGVPDTPRPKRMQGTKPNNMEPWSCQHLFQMAHVAW